MYLSLLLFIIGVLGFVLNRRNLVLMLISLEVMLLSITYLILISSVCFDDITGQVYGIYIISIAGAESAIGLGIFVAFYRLRGTVSIETEDDAESIFVESIEQQSRPLLMTKKEISKSTDG
jgi:NADH-ubiquinone oxidoreductase chain 4L